MTWAALVLLGLLQDPPDRVVDRMTFEEARPEDEAGERVVAVLKNPDHWRAGCRAIRARLGVLPAPASLAVSFDYEGEEVAKASVRGGQARIRFNLRKLEALQRKIDDLEKRKRELAKEGKRLVFKVPPARLDRIVWHELTHVFHGDLEAPEWFTEGMAQWLSEDMNCLRGFVHEGRAVEAVEEPLADDTDVYARGHLFWSWVAARDVTKDVVRAAAVERVGWKASLEKALGQGWTAIVTAEQAWSAKEVDRLRAGAR